MIKKISVILTFILSARTVHAGEKPDEGSHEHHTKNLNHHDDDHYTEEMKATRHRIYLKMCSDPNFPLKNVEIIKKFDACGSSMIYGRTNVRNCFTQAVGFQKRVTLEGMYAMECRFTVKMRKHVGKEMHACLTKIAHITSKPEFTAYMEKIKSLRTREVKKEFSLKFTELIFKCQEASLIKQH